MEVKRKSVLLTGPPGSGKSSLLQKLLQLDIDFEVADESIKSKKLIPKLSIVYFFDCQNSGFYSQYPWNKYVFFKKIHSFILFVNYFFRADYASIGRPQKRNYKYLLPPTSLLNPYLSYCHLLHCQKQNEFWYQ